MILSWAYRAINNNGIHAQVRFDDKLSTIQVERKKKTNRKGILHIISAFSEDVNNISILELQCKFKTSTQKKSRLMKLKPIV